MSSWNIKQSISLSGQFTHMSTQICVGSCLCDNLLGFCLLREKKHKWELTEDGLWKKKKHLSEKISRKKFNNEVT